MQAAVITKDHIKIQLKPAALFKQFECTVQQQLWAPWQAST